MAASILVGYATDYGSTQEVAREIATTLDNCGFSADLQPVQKVRTLAGYSAVVLGAPLLMFRWHKHALHFLERHKKDLLPRPVAVFALGPTHIPHDQQEWLNSQAQLDKELAKFPWFQPVALKMFGGKYDPAKLRFPIKLLIGKEPPSDLRDWTEIRTWASQVSALLLQKPENNP